MKLPRRIAIRAWEFVAKVDDSPPGVTLRAEPPVRPRERGLHGGITILDALQYASGPILCRTQHWGDVDYDSRRLCSSRRKTTWALDVSDTLHFVAVTAAEEALKTHCHPADPRCLRALDAKRQWIAGGLDDDALKAIGHSAAALVEPSSARFFRGSPEWYAAKSSSAAALPTAHEAAAGALVAAAWANAEASIVADSRIQNEPAVWHAAMVMSMREWNRLLEQVVAEYRRSLR